MAFVPGEERREVDVCEAKREATHANEVASRGLREPGLQSGLGVESLRESVEKVAGFHVDLAIGS